MPVFPFTIYANEGFTTNWPPAWKRPGGIYELPIKLESRARILYAVLDDGHYIGGCLVMPGGDFNRAYHALSDRLAEALAARDRPFRQAPKGLKTGAGRPLGSRPTRD